MATVTYSEPPTRTGSPTHKTPLPASASSATLDRPSPVPSVTSTTAGDATPPVTRPIPSDFRSSLSAWWSSSGYRDARVAEERLLRRLEYYTPPPPQPTRSWYAWGTPTTVAEQTTSSLPVIKGFQSTLRNVFIPAPDPNAAPLSVNDPPQGSSSSTNSTSSTPTPSVTSSEKEKKHCRPHAHKHHKPKEDYINTLEISTPANADSKEAVVVLHGYAAALGFYFRNWDAIATSAAATGRRAFFLDWLGMGLSSRPSPSFFHTPAGASTEARVSRAEHFFLSSLESWRAAEGVERMVLVGHSLGGYLASAYALRYPERVSSLILVSPAGIPHGPEEVVGPRPARVKAAGVKPHPDHAGHHVHDDDAHSIRSGHSVRDEAADAAEQELGTKPGPAEAKGEAKEWQKNRESSAMRRGMTKMFIWGWEKGVSPFSILRGIGPWGPLLVGKYSSRRFAAQTPEDVRDLHNYIYGTSILKGSGEYCISHILAPGAYARLPIVDRIHKLKMPVTFLYGDNDWMDVEGGYESQAVLASEGNKNVGVHVVPNAGHHLYLDNPTFTNRIFDEAIRAAPK